MASWRPTAQQRFALQRLADALGVPVKRVWPEVIRAGIDSLTSLGPAALTVVASGASLADSATNGVKHSKLDELIRAHHATKSDGDIGRLMEPAVSRTKVYSRRLALGIKKPTGSAAPILLSNAASIRDMVEKDKEEFQQLINERGYSMAEYIRFKGWTASRERLRQVVDDLGLKHAPQDRGPDWCLWRRARLLGNLRLMDEVWLRAQIALCPSHAAAAAALKIPEGDMHLFAGRFKIVSVTPRSAKTVTLVCNYCQKPFERLQYLVDQAKKRRKQQDSSTAQLLFYCEPYHASLARGQQLAAITSSKKSVLTSTGPSPA